MPSEYQKWLARNEKPQEKRQLTPAEKRKNWLYYHKWHLVAAGLAILFVVTLVGGVIDNRLNGPDLQIAYVGEKYLSEETVETIQKTLAPYAGDITGNGQVNVRLQQYVLDGDPAIGTKFVADLASGESRIFILEDPKEFQEVYGVLGYADGVFGEAEVREEPLWYSWADCPALTELELDAASQSILGKLFIGRRGLEKDYEHGAMENDFWAKLMAGVIE